MCFKEAVNATAELSGAFRPGIQAIAEADRNRLDCDNTRRLAGSVNLEECLRPIRAGEPIWDYGIGWCTNGSKECAIWIEVHPASSGHVRDVINKAKWLKDWLCDKAPALNTLTRPEDGYVWIASGRVALQRGSPQARLLAMAGVSFPREKFRLC
jgi:hypothetical protein